MKIKRYCYIYECGNQTKFFINYIRSTRGFIYGYCSSCAQCEVPRNVLEERGALTLEEAEVLIIMES